MRLTAIVPNYNHAALLPRCLDGLARQTRQADEILVIDDASTDDSKQVVRAFAERMPSLRLLENTHRLGAVATLNRGLHAATGDAIYCGAADDAVDPAFFATVLGALERHPTAALACAEARLLAVDGRYLGLRPANMPTARERFVSPAETAGILRRMDNFILSVVTVLRRDRVLAAGGFDEALLSFCDSFLERRIALECGFVFIPRVLGTWYIQPESYSREIATDPQKMHDLRSVVRTRLAKANGNPFPPWYKDVFDRRARFASARLAVTAAIYDAGLVNRLAQGTALDRKVLTLTGALPSPLARVAALAWLTLRLQPTSLTALMLSAARRKLRGTDDRRPQ